MKRFITLALLGFALTLWFLPVSPLHADDLASGARLHKKFKLLPGKDDDRYEIFIPFEVTAPGRVRVYIDPTGSASGSGEFPRVLLVDARIFEKVDLSTWTKIRYAIVDNALMNYHPTLRLCKEAGLWLREKLDKLLGRDNKPDWYHGSQKINEKTPLVHDVDDKELRKTEGRYLVMLRNGSSGEFHGSVLVSFPGGGWEVEPDLEAAYERKPDLAVEKIELDPDNRVLVTVANRGPGWLHQVRYNREGERVIRLEVEVNGKKEAAVPLAEVDPKYALVSKGAPVTYRTEIRLAEPAHVSAVIDAGDVVSEPDERNNRRRESLTPRAAAAPASGEPGKRVKRDAGGGSAQAQDAVQQSGGGAPDLVAADIFLDNRRRVAVRIENRGAGLPADLYRATPPVQAHLLMNGRSWAYVPLAGLDPAGALRQSGGSAVWTSDHVLREAADITLIVDEGNRLAEGNEENNRLTRRLSP